MKSDSQIISLFTKQSKMAKAALNKQYDNTKLCQSYYNDVNSSYKDEIAYDDAGGKKRRVMVNFQKIGRNIDSVVGFMAQNRRQAKYVPRVTDSQKIELYSKGMNASYEYLRENCNADQLESRQDLEVLVNGYGAIDTDLSYMVGKSTSLPNGEIVKINIDPLRVYWDAKDTTPNLLNSGFAGYWSDYPLKEALNLFQGSVEKDFEVASDTSPSSDSGYTYNPYGGLYDKIKAENSVEWSKQDEELVRVYNHQWFEYETFYKAKNPIFYVDNPMDALFVKARLDVIKSELKSYTPDGINAGDLFDFDPSVEELVFDKETKAKLIAEFGDIINPVSFVRKCFYTAIISGKHIFAKFKNISQRHFTIQFKTGQYNNRGKFWIGMCNSMIEPTLFYNKALTELMFAIAANSKGGVIVEEGAVEDLAELQRQYSKTDGVVVVQDGGLSRIQDKARPSLPTGLDGILQLSEQSIIENGVDPSFVGESNDRETGILYKRRIRQVISKMWWVSDAVTLYQKEDARLCADLIRVWVENNAGEMIRIIGPDGADEFITLSQDMLAPAYDVTIQEGAKTPEDKQELSQLLSSVADKYLSVGDNMKASGLYVEAVKLLPMDGDMKNRISKVLVGDGQSVSMQEFNALKQQLDALNSAMNNAQVQNLNSQTAVNQAKIADINATVRKKAAEVINTTEEAKQKNAETEIIRKHANTAQVTV